MLLDFILKYIFRENFEIETQPSTHLKEKNCFKCSAQTYQQMAMQSLLKVVSP